MCGISFYYPLPLRLPSRRCKSPARASHNRIGTRSHRSSEWCDRVFPIFSSLLHRSIGRCFHHAISGIFVLETFFEMLALGVKMSLLADHLLRDKTNAFMTFENRNTPCALRRRVCFLALPQHRRSPARRRGFFCVFCVLGERENHIRKGSSFGCCYITQKNWQNHESLMNIL